MTCRHGPNDQNCSSYRSPEQQVAMKQDEIARLTKQYKLAPSPDVANYDIDDVMAVGSHVVLKVTYPSCKSCSYEGTKVMVFLNTGMHDVVKWKKIDPHFREPGGNDPREAPSPSARFPATPVGWSDAIEFATRAVNSIR